MYKILVTVECALYDAETKALAWVDEDEYLAPDDWTPTRMREMLDEAGFRRNDELMAVTRHPGGT